MTTTTDPHGWPDPARPGYPKNPDRDGWHWCRMTEKVMAPIYWNTQEWWDSDAWGGQPIAYLGPCLTPAEVAAAVQAERAACLKLADEKGIKNHPRWGYRTDEAQAAYDAADDIADDIRARGPADALAEALAQARREGAMAQREHIALIFEANDMTSTADEIRALPIRSAAVEDGK